MTFRTERRTLPRLASSFSSRPDRLTGLGIRKLWRRVPKGREGGRQPARSEQFTPGAALRGGLAFLAAVALAASAAACGGPEHPNADDREKGARAPSTSQAAPLHRRTEVLGRSSLGRPIHAVELAVPEAERVVLVVGCIHGTECAGTAIARRLLARARPKRTRLWVIPHLNPDGYARGTRTNARGVDLNRNFPAQWRRVGALGQAEFAGRRPLSEPESRLAVRLIRRVHPDLSIWFHQPQAVVRAWGPSVPAARRYARRAGARFRLCRG